VELAAAGLILVLAAVEKKDTPNLVLPRSRAALSLSLSLSPFLALHSAPR
jgi:hypothetical protein